MKKFPITQTIIAIFLGIILSFMAVMQTESILVKFGTSPVANPSKAAYDSMIKDTPTSIFLIYILGHALSSFFGSYLACRLSPQIYKTLGGFVVGFILLLGGIVLFFSFNFPLWVGLSTCISYLLFSFLAIKIATK